MSSYTSTARQNRHRRLAAMQQKKEQSSSYNNNNTPSTTTSRVRRTTTGSSNNSSSTPSTLPSAFAMAQSPPRSPRASYLQEAQNPHRRPPIVSPQHHLSPSKSWDEDRSVRLAPRARRFMSNSDNRSVSSEMVGGYQQQQQQQQRSPYSRAFPQPSSSDRSVVSDSFMHLRSEAAAAAAGGGELLPMDEVAADVESLSGRPNTAFKSDPVHRPNQYQQHNQYQQQQANDTRPPSRIGLDMNASASRRAAVDDDVSSLGGVEDQNSSLQRITAAVKSHSSRPSGLSIEEKTLWDSVQVSIKQARVESTTNGAGSSSAKGETTSKWETTCREVQDQAKMQQKEHDRALRAIQRVLADITVQRDEALIECKKTASSFATDDSTTDTTATTAVTTDEASEEMEAANVSLQRELQTKTSRVVSLERQLKIIKSKNRGTFDVRRQEVELEKSKQRAVELGLDVEALTADVDAKTKLISKLKRHVHGNSPSDVSGVVGEQVSSSGEWNAVQEELEEKKSALENAKMIITSLENASGSLASDMRSKLKAKDDELAMLKMEVTERKKTMDTLATELRDLQCEQGDDSRQDLAIQLEKNLDELRDASVIVEATQDAAALDRCLNVLSDSIQALKAGADTFAASSSSRDSLADRRHDEEVSNLKRDLKEKKTAMKRLEGNFRRLADEAVRYQAENERLQGRRDTEMDHLHNEVAMLRQQCNTNLDVLTKKEQELYVLRDSLRVEDDVGYISDDGTDGYDTEPEMTSSLSLFTTEQYSPSQTEALARLRAHGGSGSFDLGHAQMSPAIDSLKSELADAKGLVERSAKDLKSEKESLANAKMIISALEKSNNSMMEDLRKRLQDSNTAITSLLAKSMESDQSTSMLKAELESVRRENEDAQETYQRTIEALRQQSEVQ